MNQFGIVLLVSERSGSNLLRSLLGNHSQIIAPVAPHLLAEFYHSRKFYGDLRENKNVEKLVNDMIDIANHPYHNWQLNYVFKTGKENSNPSSVVSAMDFVFKQKAKQEKKLHYCSKGIHSFDYIDQIRAEVPSVKFVHLVRDPRDHVASWMKRPISLLTAYDAVLKWKREQEIIIDAVQSRNLNCTSIRYEDLISNPQETVSSILEYLNLPIEENCFTTDIKRNEELKWNPYWENLSKPIMSDNKEKFKKELSNEEINVIETIAQKEMSFFDYNPVSEQNWKYTEIYNSKLIIQRNEKSKNLKLNSLQKLQDRIAFGSNLKKKREEEWFMNNEKYQWKDTAEILEKKSNAKSRLKYLSFAFLGEKTTNKIISSIRK